MTTAIFPGRFQPPHLGHVLTLMRIYPLYDEVIIAITSYTYGGKKPQIIKPEEVAKILRKIFKHLPKYKVICVGKGFRERLRFDDLPRFDVVVCGDAGVIHNMEKLGIKNRYIERSTICGMDISGTMLRETLNAEENRRMKWGR